MAFGPLTMCSNRAALPLSDRGTFVGVLHIIRLGT